MVTKERLIENATKLFMARGCKSLTMDDISAANGISKRTLYEMFADKSALLEACINVMAEKRKQVFEEAENTTTNVLEFLIKIYDFDSSSLGNISEVFFDEIQKFYPDVYERTFLGMKCEHEKYIKLMLNLGRDQGVFMDDFGSIELEAKVMAFFVQGPVNIQMAEFDKNMFSRTELFVNTVIIYLRGFSTPKGMKIIDDYFLKGKTEQNITQV